MLTVNKLKHMTKRLSIPARNLCCEGNRITCAVWRTSRIEWGSNRVAVCAFGLIGIEPKLNRIKPSSPAKTT